MLDASALLVALFGEPGGDTVQGALTNAVISSVNWAEVLQKSLEQGKSIEGLQEELELMGLTILAFTPADAEASARVWPMTRRRGIPLADRACLATAMRLGLPALTADRAWEQLGLEVEVRVSGNVLRTPLCGELAAAAHELR